MTQVAAQNTDDGVTAAVLETSATADDHSGFLDVAFDSISFRNQRTDGIFYNGEVLHSGDVLRLEFRVGDQGE